MANALTGDFDVVAQFTLPAVDRILAAMHQCERFLHSISVAVNDNPPPGPRVPTPVVIGVINQLGEAIADQSQIGRVVPISGPAVVSNAGFNQAGIIVNPGLLNPGFTIIPSYIQGIAQLQLFSPTVSVPSGQANSLTLTTNVMVRYFPAKGTAPLAQFMRGDISITAPVNKVVTGQVNVLDIDFKAQDATISFHPTYTSEPLSESDLVGINLCIANGLRTGFLPSSVALPSSIADVQLKTLPGAVAILLDMNSHSPASSPASVTNVFVTGNDDYAFAAGSDYIASIINKIISTVLSQPSQWVNVPALGLNFGFNVTLKSASFSLQAGPTSGTHSGNIVLQINAHADPTNHTYVGSVDFTVTADLFLTPDVGSVELNVGNVNVSVDLSLSLSSVFLSIENAFTDSLNSPMENALVSALNVSGAYDAVDAMFDANANLGDYLNTQLSPPAGAPPTQPQKIFFLTKFVAIQPDGIVVHGVGYLYVWGDLDVEFEEIASYNAGRTVPPVLVNGPSYSALNSWIPGGTVQQYEWSYQGQPNPFRIDPNTFVLQASGPVVSDPFVASVGLVSAYTPLCLTMQGTRIRNYGPGAESDSVSASLCGLTRYPLPVGGTVASGQTHAAAMVAVTAPGVSGEVVVTGYTAVQRPTRGSGVPNLVVHFADGNSAGQLQVLTQALSQSKKSEVATAIIAVVPAGQLTKLRYTPGITYAEDVDGSWESLLGLKALKRPLTLIVGPQGGIAWQNDGLPDADTLSAALATNLAPTRPIQLGMPGVNVRPGMLAPNFLFASPQGGELPLGKLRGNSVVLVFCKSSVAVSMQAVRNAQSSNARTDGRIVIAIYDGDSTDSVRGLAAESTGNAILIADPKREISSAYGVEIWPTTVSVDSNGVIAGIRYGYHAAGGYGKVSLPGGVA